MLKVNLRYNGEVLAIEFPLVDGSPLRNSNVKEVTDLTMNLLDNLTRQTSSFQDQHYMNNYTDELIAMSGRSLIVDRYTPNQTIDITCETCIKSISNEDIRFILRCILSIMQRRMLRINPIIMDTILPIVYHVRRQQEPRNASPNSVTIKLTEGVELSESCCVDIANATIKLVTSNYSLIHGDKTDPFYAHEEKEFIATMRKIANCVDYDKKSTLESGEEELCELIVGPDTEHALNEDERSMIVQKSVDLIKNRRVYIMYKSTKPRNMAGEEFTPAEIDNMYEAVINNVGVPEREALRQSIRAHRALEEASPRAPQVEIDAYVPFNKAEMNCVFELRQLAFTIRKRADPSYMIKTKIVVPVIDDMAEAMMAYSESDNTIGFNVLGD